MFLEVAAVLLRHAVTSQDPYKPLTWPTLQLLAAHVDQVFGSVTAEPAGPGTAIISAASAANVIARYRSQQGLRAQAEAEFRAVLEAQQRILGPDDPSTLTTRFMIAQEVSSRGDHAAAEAAYRELLGDELRILGPDNSSILGTRHQLAHQIAARGDHAAAEAEHQDGAGSTQLRIAWDPITESPCPPGTASPTR